MLIDIKPAADGTFCVVAHTTSGNVHDFFTTQEAALEFAQEFYGQIKIRVPGQAPATDAASCLKYHTSEHNCTCPDFAVRGGSYFDEFGIASCKHILHIQQHGLNIRPIEKQIQPTAEELFARFA